MAQMNLTPLSSLVDDVWGKKGTPRRDEMEARLEEEVKAYNVGEAIKEARCKQNLTQEALAQRIGVHRAQVSKIESGRNLTLTTVARVFGAMGMKPSLTVPGLGSIAL